MERPAITNLARPATVLLLGDSRLRQKAAPVDDFDGPALRECAARLVVTLADFRRRNGFGRAIAAPQIGAPIRCIAVNLGDGPFLVLNPVITWASDGRFTMWDDCMSFPGLMVKVERHRSVSLRFQDESGADRTWESLGLAESELFQHEIDHLDGVLAVDRAIDRDSLVMREVFEARRAMFAGQVDYVIGG